MQTLEQYVIENYPEVYEEYYRLLQGLPKVGTIAESLTSGYGGGGGQIRMVTEVDEEWITLKGNGHEYLCKPDEWHKDFKPLQNYEWTLDDDEEY